MTHHLMVVSDVPANQVMIGAILKSETEKVTDLETHKVQKSKQEMEEKDTPRIIDVGDFKIKVTSVGTLDMKRFIEIAMSLPSFYK